MITSLCPSTWCPSCRCLCLRSCVEVVFHCLYDLLVAVLERSYINEVVLSCLRTVQVALLWWLAGCRVRVAVRASPQL